ncbi:MAG: hydroxysqualene dehydroxylase HpnE [Kiloniellales bacterium]|nr:hydroxysqualene dehydroxylase HpnE [Kiloniellales bacterium]
MTEARVHVVGAGIAGLACALRLAKAGRAVTLYEAAAQAGGRCRSYHDAKLGRDIDNGNHLLLSANHAALSYVEEIGAQDSLISPPAAAFPFVDLASGERWTVKPNAGPIPWWVLNPRRRIPGTSLSAHLAALRFAFAAPGDRVADIADPKDPLWPRFWEPLTVAALNTDPRKASARLLWLVLRETFAKGEAACRPLIAREGLGPSLIEPALARLRGQGAEILFNRRLRALSLGSERAEKLCMAEGDVTLAPGEAVVLALPPAVAGGLLPDLVVPQESTAIVNAHIILPRANTLPPELPFIGLVGGTADWIFARGDLASLTVSAADRLAEEPAEAIAERMWQDTAKALGLDPAPAPPVRVIKEKRATFAQTPEALRLRPPNRTRWANLALAGDWTDTGYPATIESAVRSGRNAAELVLSQ